MPSFNTSIQYCTERPSHYNKVKYGRKERKKKETHNNWKGIKRFPICRWDDCLHRKSQGMYSTKVVGHMSA